jgi:hypothetical protein
MKGTGSMITRTSMYTKQPGVLDSEQCRAGGGGRPGGGGEVVFEQMLAAPAVSDDSE